MGAHAENLSVGISFKFGVQLKKVDGWWVAHCPAVDVSSQGKTQQKALGALKEAVSLVLEHCIEEQTIDQVLAGLGFTQRHLAPASRDKAATIEVPIELVANAANHARSLARTC